MPGRIGPAGKYVDTAVALLVKELIALGCKNRSLVAKMAGGACMFEYFGANLNIGERNAGKVRILLKEHNIQLVAEDVGGKFGDLLHSCPLMMARFRSAGRTGLRAVSEYLKAFF